MKKYIRQFRHQRGFVILFTILISAIILMIGAGIFSIATRETVLSSTAREAQAAFYAADAGIECALFAQGTKGGQLIPGGTFVCGAAPVIVSGNGVFPGNPYRFDVLITNGPQDSCARVSVFDVNAGTARRVIAQGYNVCTNINNQVNPNTSNPLLVERDLDTTYIISNTPSPGGGSNPGTGGSAPSSGGAQQSSSNDQVQGVPVLSGSEPASNSAVPSGNQ